MLSFPNTTNQGGHFNEIYDNNGNRIYTNERELSQFDVSRIKSFNVNLNSSLKKSFMNDTSLDISNNTYRIRSSNILGKNFTTFSGESLDETSDKDNPYLVTAENPNKIPASLLTTINRYNRVYKTPVNNLMAAGANSKTENIEITGAKTVVVSSIFNTTHVMQVTGLQDNLPLMNAKSDVSINIDLGKKSDIINSNTTYAADAENFFNETIGQTSYNIDSSGNVSININANPFDSNMIENSGNCTIRELVRMSHTPNGQLGMSKYKYADFLFCKNIGKVSNNHLITLRRFAHPVGDNIFRYAGKGYLNKKMPDYHGFQENAAIGTLITWFGTDDNKLEDILNYSVKSTWREFNAEIQEIDSKEDNSSGGLIGMFANSFNPAYNSLVARGMSGSNSLWNKMGTSIFGSVINKAHSVVGGSNPGNDGTNSNSNYQWELMRQSADKNKIYTPQNTIQSTHKYEGKLELSHEFTLNFSYRLRALDVMNPKTVMLDLLGNILEVTYNRGHFWGGERRMIGPPRNASNVATANAFIDREWEKLEGFMMGFANGTIEWKDILGTLSDAVSSIVNTLKDSASNWKERLKDGAESFVEGAKKLTGKFVSAGASRALLGQLKNQLGRPAVYAMNSLLDGSPVGLWHVTIGNPKNPIAAFGNLILTNTKITHSGPLGFDDFPTELKVSCTLKHGRSRDLSEVARMYTKGVGAFYNTLDKNKLSEFFTVSNTATGKNVETNMDTANYAKGLNEQHSSLKAKIEQVQSEIKALTQKRDQKQKEENEKKKQESQENSQQSSTTTSTDEKSETEKNKTPKESTNTSSSNENDNSESYTKRIEELNETLNKLTISYNNVENDMNNEKYKKYISDDYSVVYGDMNKFTKEVQSTASDLYNDNSHIKTPDYYMYGHFIRDSWALRYETLGQDLDTEGRILIDENA